MNVLEKTTLLNSIKKEKQRLIDDYDNVESHYKSLYGYTNREKYIKEMEFYNFIISKWDEYKFNTEKKHLNLN
ncbi:hypothetical protein QQ020_24865 [Fulvivirgaceae bacterium BMA12]|uniref:Uncharacterized protein n=1 Tax=Agaribacillus aureus TaxID=3051825 RepID=A0ABT8LC29_9BACT|nr:hypothetical protein [Fulvivirgaceae bacterium BMA12]